MGTLDWMRRGLSGGLLFACFFIPIGHAQPSQEKFIVTYKSQVEPMPLNRIHSWRMRVETTDGMPVTGADIRVDGGMPAHGHGLPTQPVVREIGEGNYLVEGLKFSMTGYWEMWFEIKAGGISEKKKFALDF